MRSVTGAGQSLCCRLNFPQEYAPEVIAKGSVTLDGISLTVNDRGPDFLEVNIIPDTQKRTTMRNWRPGTLVNMETDLIGKYVRSLLVPWLPQGAEPAAASAKNAQAASLSREMLLRNGFI